MVNEPAPMLHDAEETPWSNSSVLLPNNPSIDDALAQPEIGFTVRLSQLYYQPPPDWADHHRYDGSTWKHTATLDEDGSRLRQADELAVVRTDTGIQLGTVKPGYVPYQNHEMLDLIRPAVENGELELESVASIRGGKRIMCIAKTRNDPVEVIPGDPVMDRFCLGTGHGGQMSLFKLDTHLRMACTNIIAMMMRTAKNMFRVQHTKTIKQKALDIPEQIKRSAQYLRENVELYSRMAKVDLTERNFRHYVYRVFEKKATGPQEYEKETARLENIVERVRVLFEGGRGTEIPGVKGTLWGAFNSVTEFLNYERGRVQAARFEGLFFGEGNRLTSRALTQAKKLVSA